MRKTRDHAAADHRLTRSGRLPFAQSPRHPGEAPNAEHRRFEQCGRNEQQESAAHVRDERRRQNRPGDSPQRAARGDESEQPPALVIVEDIHQEAPEHRDHEQVENGDPHEEDPPHPDVLAPRRPVQKDQEEEQVGREKPVGQRDKAHRRQPRNQRGKRRIRRAPFRSRSRRKATAVSPRRRPRRSHRAADGSRSRPTARRRNRATTRRGPWFPAAGRRPRA